MSKRPEPSSLVGKDASVVPMSLQRVMSAAVPVDMHWVGPEDAKPLPQEEKKAYELAHGIMCHLCVRAPTRHESGHPGGPLSSFTFAYFIGKRRDPSTDQPLRYSAGHLSLLAYGLQWMFGREGTDSRIASIDSIIETFRTPSGLPGHVEAGIGDIPFGTGPLGKGASNGLGVAFGLKHQKKPGIVDVLLADGDSQEGQVMEAFRLAAHLGLDNLVVHGDFNDIQLSGIPSKTVAADFAKIAAASGWRVIEVQNGNDPAQVSSALELADTFMGKGRPVFICYYTTMGNGVELMEEGSNTGKENFHGTPLKKEVSEAAIKKLPELEKLLKDYEPHRQKEKQRYDYKPATKTDILLEWKAKDLARNGYSRTITDQKGAARKDFGETHIKNLMKSDPRIVVLHADLAASGGFEKVGKEFPDRVVNVGVAEANMYMMAAGMRQTGLLPVTYTFASFGTNEARANARLIDINCTHTRCGVIHDCTHSGLSVGEDGETHQEQNYLNVPLHQTQVWMPADSNQAAAMAERAFEIISEGHQSVYVFSPRSGHPQVLKKDGKPFYGPDYAFEGHVDVVHGNGGMRDKVTIIATGIGVHDALLAAERLEGGQEEDIIPTRVLNVACLRPIDASAIIAAALETSHLVVVEDHNSEGGLASQVADIIADFQLPCSLRRLGLTHYFPSGTADDLKFMAGLDPQSIVDVVQDASRTEVVGGEDAFVTCVHAFMENLRHSRFRGTAAVYIERLLEEKNYLESLRTFWKGRGVDGGKLPKNDALRLTLGKVLESDMNPLGGVWDDGSGIL